MTDGDARDYRLSVEARAGPARLDRFLAAALPEISRSRLKQLIEAGRVSVGGATIAEPSYRVKPGQTVELSVPPAVEEGRPEAETIALKVVYEDADLIVVDKPPGMAVHPAPGTPAGTLVNALIAHCGASLSGIGGVRRPGIVHRLDKDTSGLIVAAKHDRAHAGLAAQFAARSAPVGDAPSHAARTADRTGADGKRLSRTYLALVWGTPVPARGEIAGNIGRSPKDRKKMAVLRSGGRPALTRYRVIETFFGGALSLVECTLATGRTHQIRVHMAHQGHPLIGDQTYGRSPRRSLRRSPGRRKPPDALPPEVRAALANFKRQALHARKLAFTHPITGEPMQFEAELPADMQRLLGSLADRGVTG
ncbi:MAG: pseudouridine synthase [Alphaproteobacteria bacterium]